MGGTACEADKEDRSKINNIFSNSYHVRYQGAVENESNAV